MTALQRENTSENTTCFLALLNVQGEIKYQCVCSWFFQWYQWYTDVVQGSTNGSIGNTIGNNGNANGTIDSPNGTIGKPMVTLATNGIIGKMSMVSLGEPRTDHIYSNNVRLICLILFQNLLRLSKEELECEGFQFLEPPKITSSLWDTEVIPETTADVESQPSSAQNPMETDKCEVGNFAKWYS